MRDCKRKTAEFERAAELEAAEFEAAKRRGGFALVLVLALLAAVPASAQTFRTNAGQNQFLTAANQCATLDLSGTGTLGVQVEGTYSGTVTWTVAVGDTYGAIELSSPDGSNTGDESTTSTGIWTGAVAGLTKARACMTSYVSGSAKVTLAAVGTGGGGSAGGGVSGGGGDLELNGETILPVITGDETNPFLVPVALVNSDGTVPDSATVNYHDNPALVQQDGPVGLCKSWSGVPDSLTFDTNLTWLHCNTKGDQFVVPALDGVALFPAAAALADNTANPTLTKIAAYNMVYDGSTWDRWTGAVTVAAGSAVIGAVTGANSLPIIPCNLVYTGAPSADAVAISASGTTYICSIHIDAEGTVDTRIISGTGSTCGTSTTQMSPMYQFSTTTGVLGTNEGTGLGMIMKSDASEDVCVDVSAGVVNNIRITYAQF